MLEKGVVAHRIEPIGVSILSEMRERFMGQVLHVEGRRQLICLLSTLINAKLT